MIHLKLRTNRYIDMVERMTGRSHWVIMTALKPFAINYNAWRINRTVFDDANQFVVALMVLVEKTTKQPNAPLDDVGVAQLHQRLKQRADQ